MAVRLIIAWLVLVALCGWGAWFLSRAPRPALWIRVAVSGALLAGFAVSFLMYGDHLDKTFGAVLGYFLLWGSVFVLSAASAGTALGTLLALTLDGRSARPTD